mmetsp:Transcript_25436/g.43139  ORF Transcript_25436/g.43139 Transcript_25436/m.43139 type:complete len:130 (-) Transcript_25436:1561-1950(-)
MKPSNLNIIGSINEIISIMNIANVDSEPAKPAIIDESTMLSSGPALERKDPRDPLKAQLSKLTEKVPRGKPGSLLLYLFANFHLVNVPKGVNSREIANSWRLGSKKTAKSKTMNIVKKNVVASDLTDGM